MKIILTGSTGFIGSRLVDRLSKINSFKILSISRKNIQIRDKNKIQHIKCDLKSLNKIKDKIVDFNPDALIHLAWDKIPDFSRTNSEENEKNSKYLINFLIKFTSIRHIVVSGSCFEVYPPNKSYKYFIKAKKNIFKFLKKKTRLQKIKYTWLRIFYVYGPEQRKGSIIPYLMNCFNHKKIANINEPNKRHDFVYIDDVCEAIIKVIKKSKYSSMFEVGSGKVNNIKKIVKLFKDISNNNLKYKLSMKSKKNKAFKANINKNSKEISWKPRIKIEQGLRKTFKSY